MKHIIALVLKFAIIAVVLELILPRITNLSVLQTLYVALTVTIIAYLIGDLFILAKSNNTVATLSDAGLAFITIWAFNFIYRNARISLTDALIAAVVLAVGEWIYHKYVRRAVFPDMEKVG